MHQQQQDMRIGGQREQLGTQRRLGGQVKAMARGRDQSSTNQGGAGVADEQRGQCRIGVENALIRDTLDLREDGAQAFVAGDDIAQGRLQRRPV